MERAHERRMERARSVESGATQGSSVESGATRSGGAGTMSTLDPLERQTDEGRQELHQEHDLVITGGPWPELEGDSQTMIINMGPQHPSTHGVLRLMMELDGETVVRAKP